MFNEHNKIKNIINMDIGYGKYNVYSRGLNHSLSFLIISLKPQQKKSILQIKKKLFEQISNQDIIVITNPNQISNFLYKLIKLSKNFFIYRIGPIVIDIYFLQFLT